MQRKKVFAEKKFPQKQKFGKNNFVQKKIFAEKILPYKKILGKKIYEKKWTKEIFAGKYKIHQKNKVKARSKQRQGKVKAMQAKP